ncbi:DNA topoisomerase 1, partial [Linderina pennispora]
MPKSNSKPKPEPKANGKPAVTKTDKKPRIKKEASEVSKPKQPAKSVANRKPLIKAESSMVESSADGSMASEGEGEGDYKWWLDEKDGSSEKWHTLEHNGVMFPPDYVPHGVPLIYRKKEIRLVPEAEEVATFFAAVVDGDHGNNPVFQKNFFTDFKEILDRTMPKHPIKDFKHCDFTLIRAHLDEQSAKRKALSKEEKERIKLEKQAIEEKFKFCLMDGRREKVGNFRIEPPDLFRGRGAHPKTGMLKKRVLPEQVTINIGKDAKVPDPPAGHRWGSVTHDNT